MQEVRTCMYIHTNTNARTYYGFPQGSTRGSGRTVERASERANEYHAHTKEHPRVATAHAYYTHVLYVFTGACECRHRCGCAVGRCVRRRRGLVDRHSTVSPIPRVLMINVFSCIRDATGRAGVYMRSINNA